SIANAAGRLGNTPFWGCVGEVKDLPQARHRSWAVAAPVAAPSPRREPSSKRRHDMKIRDVMTHDAKLTSPDDTIRHAAQMMKECDCGVLPVADGDHLVGMITDRDIAVRCIADGKGPDTKIREAMTQEVMYCFEDEESQHICQNMA